MTQPEQPQYPARNEFRMGRQDNVIDIQIAATSPEVAQRICEMVERHCIGMARNELVFNWQKDG